MSRHPHRRQIKKAALQMDASTARENTLTIGLDGPACLRCEQLTQIRTHQRILEKHLSQPFYYKRWFYCSNKDCRTKQINPKDPAFIVFADTPSGHYWRERFQSEWITIKQELAEGNKPEWMRVVNEGEKKKPERWERGTFGGASKVRKIEITPEIRARYERRGWRNG